MATQRYLLHIEGDVTPYLHGPFSSEEERFEQARGLRASCGDADGLFPLDIEGDGAGAVRVTVDAYSGAFFAAATNAK